MQETEKLIVLFDGECNMCSRAVTFVIDRDRRARFRFASLQSTLGQGLLENNRLSPESPSSLVLLEQGRCYLRSTAVLRIVRRLRFPWFLLYAFIVVPPVMRDSVYRWIARKRRLWFGSRDACRVPDKRTPP